MNERTRLCLPEGTQQHRSNTHMDGKERFQRAAESVNKKGCTMAAPGVCVACRGEGGGRTELHLDRAQLLNALASRLLQRLCGRIRRHLFRVELITLLELGLQLVDDRLNGGEAAWQ